MTETYEEITAPLRILSKKDVKFQWGAEQDAAYMKLLDLMESPATLRPFVPGRKTHFMADSSEVGIQASIYQEESENVWVPIDHTSRALTAHEQDYTPIERESSPELWYGPIQVLPSRRTVHSLDRPRTSPEHLQQQTTTSN